MDHQSLHDQAEECRRRALAYLGRPEAVFLLDAAREFERLAEGHWGGKQDDRKDGPTRAA